MDKKALYNSYVTSIAPLTGKPLLPEKGTMGSNEGGDRATGASTLSSSIGRSCFALRPIPAAWPSAHSLTAQS